ncbi:MAG: hypothetical protein A3D27_03350 [Omnitrophica WOR_2 bacterium RIFCSPHIGHO2_02_FULL_46_37]|nr:MAG: hypothetical protein A3D27_03350 [Omnitrophica WOR_2 bacterium RIFCSPHIGHO2_02_FULL_46_37]
MGTLVEELKKDHEEIVEVLTKVKKLGISSKDGQDMLLAAKGGLLAHLKKEDERLYPPLRKAAENNQGLKTTLDMFAKDMESISKNAIDFFGKYAKGDSGIEFAKDFGRLAGILSMRIRKEEKIIYAEYEKLLKG